MRSDERVSEKIATPLGRTIWFGWGVIGLVATFHILAVLGASLREGRLAVAPTYDDVAYLVEGLLHLDAFESGGFRKLLLSFGSEPPHAPLNTLIATTGTALTPGSRVGAYLMDGVWVFLTLILSAILLRRAPKLLVAGLMGAMLAVPLLGLVVSEFRPDLSWGLLTGFVSLILLTTDLTRLSLSSTLLLGVLIGVDILSKPTGFMPVLASLGVAYVFSAVAQWADSPYRIRELLRPTLLVAAAAGLVTAFYYWFAWNDLILYIKKVLFSDRDLWVTEKRSLGEELTYYFDQSGTALGWLTPWAPALVIVWMLRVAVVRPFSSHALIRAIGVLAVIAVSYAVASVTPVKTWFLGCIYYGTVIAASMWALANLLQSFRVRPILVAVAGAIIFIGCWSPRSHVFNAADPAVIASDEAYRAISPAVVKYLAAQDRQPPSSLVMDLSPGPVYMHALQYNALLADVPGRFSMIWEAPSFEALMKTIVAADVNVISQRGALGQSPANFPIYPYLDRIIQALQADPEWRSIASFTDKAGFKTYAFVRASKAVAAGL